MNSIEPKDNVPRALARSLKEAVLITAGCAVFALLGNLVHPERIPYIADQEYEILVPCPEPGGEVLPINPGDSVLADSGLFFIDARLKTAFDAWHFREAVNVTYDYLDPTPKETLIRLAKDIAHSKAKKVIVYGDGDLPDTGEQLGKEISGYGIKNVHFLKGGAPALKTETASGGHQ